MAADDEDYGSARITIDLDDTAATAQASAVGDQIRRALLRSTRGLGRAIRNNIQQGLNAAALSVRVVPDLDALDDAVRRHVLPDLTLDLRPDFTRLDAAVRGHGLPQLTLDVVPDLTGFVERIRAALAGAEVSIRVVPDLDDLDARIRAYRPPDITVTANLDTDRLGRGLSRLGSIAGTVAKGLAGLLAFGAVGIAASGAAFGVAAFLAALAPAAGILAAFPAAIATSIAAIGALKLALAGVGDAFKAALTGNAAAFEKSLKGLSPAAQAAAREVRALKEPFEDLRSTVQQAFFTRLTGQITATAKALGGPVQAGLKSIAGGFGAAAAQALKFFQTRGAVADIERVLSGTSKAVGGLAGAVQPVLKGLLDVAAAVSQAFGAKLGEAITSTGKKLGAYLTRLADSGRAVAAVREAIAVFRQLGALLGNIRGILSGVSEAGQAAGAGLLAGLVRITEQAERFVKSTAGQTALQGLFTALRAIAVQLGPIFRALVTQVGQMAPALAGVFTTLGPALVGLINAVGPAISAIVPSLENVATGLASAFAAVGPYLAPVGQGIALLVAALAPLLPLVGKIVATLAQALAPALTLVADVLAPLARQLVSVVAPILNPLALGFTQLVTALTPLVTGVGQALVGMMGALAPIMPLLAQALAGVVAAISPLIAQLTAALLPILPPVIAAFTAMSQALLPLVPSVVSLVGAVAPLVGQVLSLVAPLLQVAAAFVQWVAINALAPMINVLVAALRGFIGVLTAVVGGVRSFVSFVVGLFRSLYNTLVGNSIVPDLVNGIVFWFTSLPGRILAAIAGLVGAVVGVFRSMASAAVAATSTFISRAVGVMRALPGRARAAIVGLISAVGGVVRSMASTAVAAFTSFVSQAVGVVRGLPGRARAALAGVGGVLVSAGRDLIMGMINGVKSAAGGLVSAAKGAVQSAVDGAKSLLGISSPSKVFMQIGRDTGRGFILGLIGTAAQIQQTTERIARQITDAFKGRRTTVDDALVRMVQAGNKRLQTLASQRDALIKRIADARKFAADTAVAALQTGALQSLTQGDEAVTTQGLARGLKAALAQVKTYTRQVNDLAKRGLRKDLLDQLIGLGPERGAALASALSGAGKGTLRQINSLQKQLADASKKFGNDSADILYDAGKLAGKGLLEGLKGQQKAIEALMLQIARGMQQAIRTALRIKSPSQVFRGIGDQTGAGLGLGLIDSILALRKAAAEAADQVAASVAGSFAALPALITQSLGTVSTTVLNQLRSGLPTAVRGLLPFADGGIVDRPTLGLLGEAGREVVLPLTRPQRARQLADQSGLMDVLAGAGNAGSSRGPATGTVINQTVTIHEVGDARATAHRVVSRLALAAPGL